MIATLRPFARGWSRALFFTIETEGLPREGFKIDRMAQHWACGVVDKALWVGLDVTVLLPKLRKLPKAVPFSPKLYRNKLPINRHRAAATRTQHRRLIPNTED